MLSTSANGSAFADIVGNPELCQTKLTRRIDRDRITVQVTKLERTLLLEQDVDAIGKMGSNSANSLGVVLAIMNHLPKVDVGQLNVPLTSDIGIEKECGADDARASLSDTAAFGLMVTALVRARDKASPAAKALDFRKAVNRVNERMIDGGTVDANAVNGGQGVVGIQALVKRLYGRLGNVRTFLLEDVTLLLQLLHIRL